MANGKVLLIGWDAADWRIIHPLVDAGKMPVLEGFINSGVIGNLATLQPPLSPTLWTSVATGKRPFDHGVHGFSEPDPVSGNIRPVTNLSRTTKAIWNILNQNDKKSIVVGWWPSHPAEPIDGVMVSNQYQRAVADLAEPWPMQKGTVHPERLEPLLADLRFHPGEVEGQHILPFVPRAPEIDQEKDPRLSTLAKILADTVSVHAAATALMQTEPWDFMAVYYDAIDHFGHAFMKYHPPRRASVPESDFEFYKGVVDGAYQYHDTMLGALLHLAGEDTTVILMSDHGFHPDHLRPAAIPAEPAGPAAEHRDLGILAASGPGIKKDERVYGASLLDICPTVLSLFDLPIGEDMSGRPLLDMFETPPAVTTIPSWDEVPGNDGSHPPDKQIAPADAKEAINQLVALGYIAEPDAEQSKAVEETVRELRYNLAQSYMDGGRYADAEILLEALLEQWPDERRFGAKLAACYRAIGRIPKLRSLVDRLVEQAMRQAEEAKLQLEQMPEEDAPGKDAGQEAIAAFQQTQKLRKELTGRAHPNLVGLEQLRAYADFAEQKYEEALEKLGTIRASHPSRPELWILTGEIYLRQRRWDEADEAFNQALAAEPESPLAYRGLARACLARHEFAQAATHALASIGLLFHQPFAHYLLGMASYRQGDFEQAACAFAVCVKQNPTYPRAYRMLREIYRRHLIDAGKATMFHAQMQAAQERIRSFEEGRLELLKQPEPAIPASSPPEGERIHSADALAGIPEAEIITIVTGLPRSGTSMMMQMLDAGGLPILTDGQRVADANNPRGYYELAKVARLNKDAGWIEEAKGKALKVVVQQFPHLPLRDPEGEAYKYRVIFMQRNINEVVDSQSKMLKRNEKEGGTHDLRTIFTKQVNELRSALLEHSFPTLYVEYTECIAKPDEVCKSLNGFFNNRLNAAGMEKSIDPELYRERR